MKKCPNCGSVMEIGDPCPECNHDDGDLHCWCEYCLSVLTDEDGGATTICETVIGH